MTTWRNQYVRKNEYTRPGTKLKGVRKIVVHWTANSGGSASNHFTYFDRTAPAAKRYASAHIFVDKAEAICIVPLGEVAYHANDGSYRGVPSLAPNANLYSIGVEMCVEKDGSIHPDTIVRTEAVMRELCEIYKLDPVADIVRHYDVTHKNCPEPWVKDGQLFADFKARIKACMNPKEAEQVAEKNEEYKLTANDEKVIAELKRLGITDGKNPMRPVTQLYLWHVVHGALQAKGGDK